MPTVAQPRKAVPRPLADPQLQRFGDDILTAFRAAAQKAIVSAADPARATLTDDRGSIEYTMLALYRGAPEGARSRASERVLAMLDGSDRPHIELRSKRSVELQLTPSFDTGLVRALRLAGPVTPAKPVVVVPDVTLAPAAKAIAAKHATSAFLGRATTSMTTTPDGAGRFRHYEHGSIYWTADTGAHEVHGAIAEKWASLGWERGVLGYPTTDETTAPDGTGRFNHFQGGSIYWSPPTGAHEIHGAIRAKWAALRFETGYLGYPTTDELATPDTIGRFNHFEGGSIYWTPARDAFAVHAEVRDVWAAERWELGDLGYPIEDTRPGAQKRQRFEGGAIESKTVQKPKSKVQLRLHSVALLDETNSSIGSEWGHDEMHMGGAAIDASGKTKPIERFHVADFNEPGKGQPWPVKRYDPPKVLHTFRLADSSGWPKTYVSTLLLSEVDSGGFSDLLRDLVQKVRTYAMEQVKQAAAAIGAGVGALVGAAAGIVGAAIGAVVGYVVGALFDWLDSLFADIALRPSVFSVTIPDVWAFADSKDDVDDVTGAGGAYRLRGDHAMI